VSTWISVTPKVDLRATGHDGQRIRSKVEVNTHELSPAHDPITILHRLTSSLWTGRAHVRTFPAPGLVATKIRALYQRKKGRDLFDMWLALTELALDPEHVLAAFAPGAWQNKPIGMCIRNGDQLSVRG
jgi:predicted nucleotidyltransferase component of viral defense system